MSFTHEQIRDYLAKEGSECPFCGSKEIAAIANTDDYEGEFEAIWENEVKRELVCSSCKKSWREYYKLRDIEELDEYGCAIPNEEVQAQAQEEPTPTVLIGVHGGNIDNVAASIPIRVLILDYDKNFDPLREEPEAAVVIDKICFTLRDWEPTGDQDEREAIARILRLLDLPRCDVCRGPRVNESLEQFDGYITDEDHETRRCFLCASND
ncbi:MAG: hypothetical protein AB1491_00255 [Thermodesulfobacteriota bacterium]